eukprot:13613734-Alexandrium_andersonii.AAC.1
MFVLRSSLRGIQISAGDRVQFTLRQGLQGVEATEVRPLSRGEPSTITPDEAAGPAAIVEPRAPPAHA